MSTFTPNHAGIRAMAASPAMVECLRNLVATRMKPYAEAIAPVDTGQYAHETIQPGGFHVTAGVRDGKAYGRLTNKAPHARLVEWPHRVHNSDRVIPGQHILGRSLDALRTT